MWWLVVGRGYTHPLGHLAQRCVEREDVDAAIAIHEEVAGLLLPLDKDPAWQALVRYRLASQYAGLGRAEQAIAELRRAFRLRLDLIQRSKGDPTFAAIRETPAYRALCAEKPEDYVPVSSRRVPSGTGIEP
jgi:hypothetical protein